MSFEIVHPEKPTEQDKIDDNDYMLPHQINGVLPDFSNFPGAKIRLPILIEKKTLTDVSSVLFKNLNGDQDIEYLFVYDLTIPNSANGGNIKMNPNSISTNQRYAASGADYNNSSHYRWRGAQLYFAHFEPNLLIRTLGQVTFYAKTGQTRVNEGKNRIYGSNNNIWIIDFSSIWTETSTKVTSILLDMDVEKTFSGIINLYKIVEIPLEDLATI